MRPSEIKEKLYLQAVFVYRQTCLLREKSPNPPLEPSLRDGQRILRMLELRTLSVGTDALFFVLRKQCVEVSLHS